MCALQRKQINQEPITDSAVARAARATAGCLLIAALFYSPWDSGGTSAPAIRHLNWLLCAMFVCWLVSKLGAGRWERGAGRWESLKVGRCESQRTEIGRREQGAGSAEGGDRKPRAGADRSSSVSHLGSPTSVLFLLAVALLLLGWGIALNAHAVFDADYRIFLPLSAPLPGAPGSVAYYLSVAWMWRATALLGCVWVVADLIRDSRWLLRIWWAIGLAGGSIALLGLLQKATGAQMIFWQTLDPGEPAVSTFFATYYYHGNAGAYLNLTLPAVLGLGYRYLIRPAHPAARALWLTLSAIVVIAVAADTSRVAQTLAVLIVLVLLILALPRIFLRVRQAEAKTLVVALLAGGLALWAIAQASHLDRSMERWDQFSTTWSRDARWQVDQLALQKLPEAGVTGFGPGTFSAVFPTLQEGADPRTRGSWLFLHDDYLQTLLEWGWAGGALWGFLFFGGMLAGLRSLTSKGRAAADWTPRQGQFLCVALVALAALALHAAVDFPLQIPSIQLYAATYLGVCWRRRGK